MTLNGVMAPILRYFTEFGSFRGALRKRKVVEDVVVKKFMFAISSLHKFLVELWPIRLRLLAVFFSVIFAV